jgi:hypothetical protein
METIREIERLRMPTGIANGSDERERERLIMPARRHPV